MHLRTIAFFSEDIFKIRGEDLFRVPTTEISVLGHKKGDKIDPSVLPIRCCYFANCFRKKAGTFGKREKLITRLHLFHKM